MLAAEEHHLAPALARLVGEPRLERVQRGHLEIGEVRDALAARQPRGPLAQIALEDPDRPELVDLRLRGIPLPGEEARHALAAERARERAVGTLELAAYHLEQLALAPRLRHGQTEAALGQVEPLARQVARSEVLEQHLSAPVAHEHRARQSLDEPRQLDREERRPHLERVLHAHAVDLGQHRAGQVVVDVGLAHAREQVGAAVIVVHEPAQPVQMRRELARHAPEQLAQVLVAEELHAVVVAAPDRGRAAAAVDPLRRCSVSK